MCVWWWVGGFKPAKPAIDIESQATTLKQIEQTAVIYSEDRLNVIQLKREAKLSTHAGLTNIFFFHEW